MEEEQAKKLKEIELEMLKQFIMICEKLDLKYYLIGGTLLGAVRHKGFIPWDDDIDVCMPRKDYNIFIAEAQKLLPKKYFIQTYHSEPNCPYCFCKMRDCDTTFWESLIKNCKINHGVFIDIFCLDYYPEGKSAQHHWKIKNTLLNFIISKPYTPPFAKKKPFKRKIISSIGRLLTIGISYQKAVKKRDHFLASVKPTNLMGNLSGAWAEKEIVPISWFGDGVEVEFEGVKANAPTHYDKWLSQVYGDYMQLPPEEKRVAHHYTEIIDLDKSYTEYIK